MGSRPRWKMGHEGKANPSFLAYCPYLLFAALLALGLTAQVQGYKEVKAFLIPHSHCDPGWLETYEGYHTRFVERILTEVMNSLSRSPDRRFVWAEISYFSRWFDTKSLETKQQVRKFVENGQLEFVEGGWVQPDEANTNFDILVNQLTEGHDYLLKNFGVRPRFAWQIDPFGHSSMTPTLAAAVGFDALVINRIHHNLKSYFKQTRHMEFVWQGSPTLGEQSEIFTHVLHTHYSAPQGFDFEEGNVSPVSPGQPQSRAQQLVNELKSRSNAYRTSNLLVTFGDDFKFQRAEHQFSNMDMLIQEINNGNYGVKIQYATLSEYFDAVFAAKADFPIYKGDFFPYADNSDSYWTGYYTTRPHLKGLTRRATSILHSAETAFALARAQDVSRHLPTSWDFHYSDIRQGRRDTALVQHHDGITGTAKPNVADDYTRRLNRAVDASHDIIADMTKHLLYDETQDRKTGLAALDGVAFGVFDEQGRLFQLDGSKATEYPLVYHNGLGWTRYQYVRVKVSAGDPDMLRIFDGDGNPVPVQTSPFSENAATEPVNKSVFFLNFLAEVPPLGVSTYFVRVVDHATAEAPRGHKARYFTHDSLASADSQLAIENEFLKLTLSAQTGLPDTLRNKLTGQTVTLDQKYAEYSTSRSGAYLFRPVSLTELSPRVHVSIVNGELMSEVVISLSSARKLTLRLYTAPAEPLSHPEVGGVLFTSHQVDASGNREVVVRYNTDIPTADMFYTDNGLELQLRSRNGNQERSRAHIEASRAGATETQYYPSISIAMLRHPWLDLQFTVISSQAMGTTSHKDGGLELMLHRHLSQDDGRGLGEGVRDTNVVTIQQWLMVGHVADAEVHRRRLSLQQDHPLTPVTLDRSPPDFVWADHFVNSYSPLTASLPPNVHLLSLKARDAVSSEVILRLIHIAEGIDSVASPDSELPQSWQSAATVKLGKLFSSEANGWAITHPRERSLSLNYGAEEVEHRIRYDSSLGLLNMKIDTSRLGRGGASQNTDEEGVFLSQAALDKMEQEKAASRKTLSIIDDADGDASYEQIDPIDDDEAYERDVRQRGQKRRVFDPTSVSVSGANQRQLLAVGKDTDPLKMLLRPLQMKSLLLLLEKTGLKAEEQLPKGEDKAKQLKEEEEEARRKQQQTEEEEEEEENKRKQLEQEAKEEEARRKQKLKKQQQEEEEEEQRRRKEEQLQHEDEATRKAEEERQEKEKQEESERRRQQVEEERRAQQKKEEEEARRKQQQQKKEEENKTKQQEEEELKHKPSGKTDTTHTGGGRRAEASFPGVRSEEDVLAAEQRFLSTGLEAERMMMMFLTIVVISLMILAYLAFHRRHASAIISVSSLASATYPWVGNNGASGSGPSGRDFYRREMDQRLYSKMV